MKLKFSKIFDNYEILFAVFLFRYQIVRLIGNEYIYYIIGILAIIMLFYKRKINKAFLYLNISVILLITLNYIVYVNYRLEIKNIFDIYLYACLMGTFIYSNCNNYKKMVDVLFVMAIINIFITGILFLNRNVNLINYMDLGYYILQTILILYLKFYNEKKYIYIFFIVPMCLFMFIYGSRGAILSFVFCVFLTIFLDFKENKNLKKIIKLIFSISLILMILFISFQEDFLTKFNNYLNSNGIYSYSITKYTNPYESFSSGRVKRYELAINDIKNRPLIGNGIGNYTSKYNLNYIHNIGLQLLDEGGIILLILVVYFIINFIIKMINEKEINKKLIYILLLSLTFKLIITSQYWSESSFWIIIMISLQKQKKY